MLVRFSLFLAFILSLLSYLVIPFLFPFFPLLYFAPCLIIAYYKKSLFFCLWLSLAIGILNDLFSSSLFGLNACNYCLVTFLLYRQTRHFFEDNVSTLFIMTLFFSLVSTSLNILFFLIFTKSFAISWSFIFTDFLIMPLLDALYAYLFFSLPLYLKSLRRVKNAHE